jgi:hypothetical protein
VVSDFVIRGISLPDFQNRPESFPDFTIQCFHYKAGRVGSNIAGTHLDALPAFIAPFFGEARADPVLRDIHQRNPVLGAGTGAGAASDAQSPGDDIENVF